MSGESLRAMIVRVESTVNVVVNGAGSSSAVPQPSSNATRLSASKRPLSLLAAPRPLRGLTGGRHIHAADNSDTRQNISRTIVPGMPQLAPHPPADAGPSLSPLSRGEGIAPSPRLRGEGRGEGQVSVIIPTLNAADTLAGLVEQLRASTIVKEIVVVDGGSVRRNRRNRPRGRRARHRGAARTGNSARRGRRRGGGRLAVVPARRLPSCTGLGSGRRCFPYGSGGDQPRRLFRLRAGRHRARGAAAGADRRLALPRSGAALWRSGPADRPQPLSRGRRLRRAAVDGGRRPRAPPRPPASRPLSARGAFRRRGATAATDIGVGRCATSSASRSIFAGVSPDRIVRLYG